MAISILNIILFLTVFNYLLCRVFETLIDAMTHKQEACA